MGFCFDTIANERQPNNTSFASVDCPPSLTITRQRYKFGASGDQTLAFGIGTWPVLLATGLAAERLTTLLRKRGVRVAGGIMVILFGIWTMPGPHQQWLMGHGSAASNGSHSH